MIFGKNKHKIQQSKIYNFFAYVRTIQNVIQNKKKNPPPSNGLNPRREGVTKEQWKTNLIALVSNQHQRNVKNKTLLGLDQASFFQQIV